MNNKDILKKKILYNSHHRGTKEMDILLGSFVKKYIDSFTNNELYELESLLKVDDDFLCRWYFNKDEFSGIPNNSVSKKLKKFKL
tara:strand:+ start:919 stop:1173 length:255 start_codon:yes stop_codon:yes gene_type:complete